MVIYKGEVIMEKIVESIINGNSNIFSGPNNVSKVDVGFTNTIYSVDDKYIIKICSDLNNEEKFKKEILFYKANEDNELIPKLYFSDITKVVVPYLYEVIEKIDGVTLYDVWHTFSEEERENVIKQLCDAMKKFHSNKGVAYDWVLKTSSLFLDLYEKAKSFDLFSNEEIKLLDEAYKRFPELLESSEFVLVHNDLHFDNIFYKDGKIKLIDFERSIYAPKDFELDILYRMIRKPWKFASEENEKYTNLKDYENIMGYIEKYYPELINIPNLYERLAIYDIVYFLKQYIGNPSISELRSDIIKAASIVANHKIR